MENAKITMLAVLYGGLGEYPSGRKQVVTERIQQMQPLMISQHIMQKKILERSPLPSMIKQQLFPQQIYLNLTLC